MSRSPVRLSIERLVLDGVPAGESAAVVAAFRAELARLLAAAPPPPQGAAGAVPALSLRLPAPGSAASAGQTPGAASPGAAAAAGALVRGIAGVAR
jgi:hypothetical protein